MAQIKLFLFPGKIPIVLQNIIEIYKIIIWNYVEFYEETKKTIQDGRTPF